ncbi:MAG: protein translocase subunit SecF [Patescibacteria group bacterium]|jgi:preprotein translocase subunit SecF
MTINIIKHSKIWLVLSGTIVTLSFLSVVVFHLNFGIDFTGGSLLEIHSPDTTVDLLRTAASSTGHEATVQQSDTGAYFVRMSPLTEEEHQAVLSAIIKAAPKAEETKFDSVGPTIGKELKRASLTSLVVLLVAIGLYIAWAFRKVSYPVKSWKYGVVTMVAAFHDVIIPIGVFAALGHFFGYQVDTAFVAAMLTILGYSINDTIVVLDRTRENLVRHRFGDQTFGEIVNRSIIETLGRSINTTLATLLPLLAIIFLGGETTRPFVMALAIGILSGAYSSIFVASPLLVYMQKWGKK